MQAATLQNMFAGMQAAELGRWLHACTPVAEPTNRVKEGVGW